jgi:hypothetical protein
MKTDAAVHSARFFFKYIYALSNMSLHSRVTDGAVFSDLCAEWYCDTSADEMSGQKL